ncbi:MAG: ABC transporter ATP-binding protein [Bacillota bacterium]|jgi:branched-chain amino acid transport system ATP-binding protein
MMARSARSCDTAQVVLKVDNLCKRFGGLVAVDNLSFAVYKGQIMGIIGPNGAGKTTAFNLISGVSSPTCGDIFLCENRITGFPSHQVALLGLRRTFQEIHLFRGLTVLQNVKSAAFHQMDYSLADALAWSRRLRTQERDVTARSMELLERFGLAEMANEPADSLPYGMQKRLEIVKAIVTNPKVLLLDEPAAGLNPAETLELMELVRKLRDEMDMTILIIEHSMEVIEGICDHVVVMNFGTKLAEGSWEEVHTNEEVIRCYLGVD